MRILLYAGKGGVGKTSIAGATGIIASRKDLRTLVLSLDPAHSLSDAFDLDRSLMDKNMGRPIPIADKLWIQELDVHEEISRHWGEVHRYISVLLNASGIEDVLAEDRSIGRGDGSIAPSGMHSYSGWARPEVMLPHCLSGSETQLDARRRIISVDGESRKTATRSQRNR